LMKAGDISILKLTSSFKAYRYMDFRSFLFDFPDVP